MVFFITTSVWIGLSTIVAIGSVTALITDHGADGILDYVLRSPISRSKLLFGASPAFEACRAQYTHFLSSDLRLALRLTEAE